MRLLTVLLSPISRLTDKDCFTLSRLIEKMQVDLVYLRLTVPEYDDLVGFFDETYSITEKNTDLLEFPIFICKNTHLLSKNEARGCWTVTIEDRVFILPYGVHDWAWLDESKRTYIVGEIESSSSSSMRLLDSRVPIVSNGSNDSNADIKIQQINPSTILCTWK
jgi:hypothetical protein